MANPREAPNDTAEVASFLVGCAAALASPPRNELKQRERQALADRLQISGTNVEPLLTSKKLRIVRTS